jgi:hypothetical protein
MTSNDEEIRVLNTLSVLEHANKRQEASQLLLLAIVDKQSRTIDEVRCSLNLCVAHLKNAAQKDFYFDLGWLESLNTILDDFTSLSWVEKYHSSVTYQSTKIGRAQLAEQWKSLEVYLGMSLVQFQELC